MTAPYFADEHVTLYQGRADTVLAQLPDGSVDCIVTSPPYYGLRRYGDSPDEQGTEPTLAAYVDGLRAVFAEAHRVLADHGTLWLNIGDTYSSKANARRAYSGQLAKGHSQARNVVPAQRNTTADAPYKSLLMVPERVALALVDDGWVLRNRITWYKPNGTPESANDRLTARSEALWLFAKRPHYYFDLDAIKRRGSGRSAGAYDRGSYVAGVGPGNTGKGRKFGGNPGSTLATPVAASNPGDCWQIEHDELDVPEVWPIATQPFGAGEHYAVMTPEVARRAILAGCPAGGVVLDPYSGAGTTGMVAGQLGRRYVGVELYEKYLDLSLRTRLRQSTLELGGEVTA